MNADASISWRDMNLDHFNPDEIRPVCPRVFLCVEHGGAGNQSDQAKGEGVTGAKK
ncbi:MAG TPA: hypothetical protein VGM64_00235 [Lacunisphaera sp.]